MVVIRRDIVDSSDNINCRKNSMFAFGYFWMQIAQNFVYIQIFAIDFEVLSIGMRCCRFGFSILITLHWSAIEK